MHGKRAPEISACVKTSKLGFKLSINESVVVRVGTKIREIDLKIRKKEETDRVRPQYKLFGFFDLYRFISGR